MDGYMELWLEQQSEGPTYERISERTVTAAKPHCCSACGRWIQPGEKYVRVFEKVDGEAQTRPEHSSAPYCNEYEPK